MLLNFQVTPNLHISGKKIISYDTHVGNITKDCIVSFGKFTRTTTKHFGAIASMLSIPIKVIDKSVCYYKYELGVKCNPLKNFLSREITALLLPRLNDRDAFIASLVDHLTNGGRLSGKDWLMLCQYWGISPDTPKPSPRANIEWRKA